MHFEWLFGGSWGQHGPKTLPKPLPKTMSTICLFESWRALGELLGPLGAQEPISSIFDRFLIDFWSIFIDFLDQFWMIFEWFLIVSFVNIGSRVLSLQLNGAGIQNVFWKLMLCQLCTACWQLRTTCSTTLSTLATTTATAKNTLYIAPSAMADCWRSPGYIYIYIYACEYIYIYVYVNAYVFICVYLYMYIYICVYGQFSDVTTHKGAHYV